MDNVILMVLWYASLQGPVHFTYNDLLKSYVIVHIQYISSCSVYTVPVVVLH
ncbi:MAG: hypothetical protein A4E24_02056 [Methanomethylovorans sp. PtaU1.Bin093]|nr:MAG: hypothetical protein A4E24_02056 [Methanomethylovorans sp. PtaU1.Bin093]